MKQQSIRTVAVICGFIFLLLGCRAQSNSGTKIRIELNKGWEFRQSDAKKTDQSASWLPAEVPGDVHLDLMRNKKIPDPYYRDNEAKLQWIEDADWSYRNTFAVTAETLRNAHVDLVFEGLDTNATVLLNGHKVLDADNMFRLWRVDARPYLKIGANELQVEFASPIRLAEKLAAADKTHGDTRIPDKSYIRKAAYEYGWDWGPRFVTSGIWQPVYLEVWNQARIEDVHIAQADVKPELAHVVARVKIVATGAMDAEVRLHYAGNGASGEAARKVQLHTGDNLVEIPVEIAKPALWYPAGYGTQPLYQFKTVITAGAEALDERSVKTGLKSVELRQTPDEWGRSFEFVVNGIPVFIKGADVIPFDSFPDRVTEARYRQVLESAKAANMNMVRLWGGGYYESDTFYDICDELGLMVWNDFMFASSWYPGSEEWKHSVGKEAEYQVQRLRNHPSIALWSGNNEVESVLYAFLGNLSADGKLQVWKNYLTTFSGVLPRVIEREDASVPYWPSSPSSDYEVTTDAFQAGDAHDWSIWHGREPFTNYQKHFYRFTSEYGFQSFPELRTVKSFTTEEDRANIFTPVMLAHQKNNEGNSIIHEYLLRDYAEPKDFPSFLYVSQVLQAEGIKIGAEHMRRSRPRIMGSLIWQLNDCWPVASWSSIDYYGRWKALQYYARRFYSPILVSPLVQDGKVEVYVVSDELKPTEGTLRARLMTLTGQVVKEEKKEITVPPLSSASYLGWLFQSLAGSKTELNELVLVTDFTVKGKEVSRNVNYVAPTRQVHLPAAAIQATLSQADKGATLTVASPVLAKSVYITFGNLDASVTDNYFDLLPGEAMTVTVTSAADLETLKKEMKIVSLVDAFPVDAAAASAKAN